MNVDLSKYEPFLTDQRVEKLAYKVRSALGFKELANTDFVTFIQPAREVEHEVNGVIRRTWIEDMAVFAVVTPHPRQKSKLMTHATSSVKDFREADKEFNHYAGGKDPALGIFKQVAALHIQQLDDLRSLIN